MIKRFSLRIAALIVVPLWGCAGAGDLNPCQEAAAYVSECTGESFSPASCTPEDESAAEAALRMSCDEFSAGKADLRCSAALRWAGLCPTDEALSSGLANAEYLHLLQQRFPYGGYEGRAPLVDWDQCRVRITHDENYFSISTDHFGFEVDAAATTYIMSFSSDEHSTVIETSGNQDFDRASMFQATELADGWTRVQFGAGGCEIDMRDFRRLENTPDAP